SAGLKQCRTPLRKRNRLRISHACRGPARRTSPAAGAAVAACRGGLDVCGAGRR
ncbi:unnamed protein product, partial [Prorocentrum cordatum]